MAEILKIDLILLDAGMAPPSYAHATDAGADLCSAIDFVLEPFERKVVPTGIAVALPVGCAGFVHPRSGLSSRHGVTVVNAPGTIDAGYRGEIKVPLINLDARTPLRVSRGDRIAQLVIQEIKQADFTLVESLDDSDRGAGGFGSTGGVQSGLTEKEV
ncbi:dUTP diphosphatase [Brevibacterium sp. BDJS002]|uniref:dUTP diphosphatase n=1 Tax=Brevibacterium sp. BDJS002 TaxID=3020906 RepID=UPI002307BCC3|nr:dUTP diphosphatase [Brevibacterium sp. BDJS002]MDN5774921.1 dUTP diphosphatase [Brevibacterium aurantiacum]WCE38695.1 dUTP diphosphatase [Brevibacterium sp. BDJS002]